MALAAADAEYLPRQRVMIFYPNDDVYHERIVLCPTTNGRYFVVTPDEDMYEEPLSTPPLLSVHLLGPRRGLPRNLRRYECHRFENGSFGGDLDDEELDALVANAVLLANPIRTAAGLPPLDDQGQPIAAVAGRPIAGAALPPAAPVAGQPLPVIPVGHELVAAESVRGVPFGAVIRAVECFGGSEGRYVVRDDGGHVLLAVVKRSADIRQFLEDTQKAVQDVLGTPTPRGVAAVAEDARTLPVRYDSRDERFREVRDCINLLTEGGYPDWPVKGPRSVLWVMRYGMDNGGSLTHMHSQWKGALKLTEADHGVSFHLVLCRAFHQALTYDQLNVSELACMETLARSLQMIQWRWRERAISSASASTHDDAARLFLGSDSSRGNVCVAPALQDYISAELHKKEQRKAREERTLLRAAKK